jgi:hypothetical protein
MNLSKTVEFQNNPRICGVVFSTNQNRSFACIYHKHAQVGCWLYVSLCLIEFSFLMHLTPSVYQLPLAGFGYSCVLSMSFAVPVAVSLLRHYRKDDHDIKRRIKAHAHSNSTKRLSGNKELENF